MKSKLYSIFLLLITVGLFSCKTASKMYQKGNYDEAVILAAKKLQKDPTDQKLLDIIQQSYKLAVDDHQGIIRAHSESSNELKWEWIYNDYASMQQMFDAIYKVPSVYNLVRPLDYSTYLTTYGEKAADVRFERGNALMEYFDKQSYRNAYREFKVAAGFKPGDGAIIGKMNEAYEFAVTNVIVLPMQQYGGFLYSTYTPGGNNLDDELLNSLRFNSGNEFLKFYSGWDARSKNIRTDMIVDMQMSTVNIGHYRDRHDSRIVSKQVLVKETVIRPDSIIKEYAWVRAEITTTRRTMVSDALLRVNVKNGQGHWIWSDNYSAAHNWSTEFATYSGDVRALTDSDKQLVDRRREFAPSEHEVIKCLVEQISRDAQTGVKNYFQQH